MKHIHPWVISAVSVLVVTAALGFGRFGYTVLLPEMQEGLSLTISQTGDLAAGNMTGYLLLAVLGGLLASRFGARRVIVISLFLVSLSMVLTGISKGFGTAFIGRALTGFGAGGANIPIMGVLAAWFARERRGLVAGIAVSGSSFGILITGLFLPRIIQVGGEVGWRYGWYTLAAGVAVVGLLTLLFLRNTPVESRTPSSVPDSTGAAPTGAAPTGVAPTGVASDSSMNSKPSRSDWRKLLCSKPLLIISIIYFAFGFSYVIYATFFAKALIGTGMSPAAAGRLWSAVGAASIASGFVWGVVSDKAGRRFALASIYLLQGLSFLAFSLQLLHGSGMAGFIVSVVLFAVTAWSIPAVMAAATSDIVGSRMASAAFGAITLFFGLGQILGPFTAGRLIEGTGSYVGSYLLASGVAILGAACSLIFMPKALSRSR